MVLRPRKSGKSLALSTIDCYFNVLYSEEDRQRWFEGTKVLEIEEWTFESGRKVIEKRGKLPVLKLDLSTMNVNTERYDEEFYKVVTKALDPYWNKI